MLTIHCRDGKFLCIVIILCSVIIGIVYGALDQLASNQRALNSQFKVSREIDDNFDYWNSQQIYLYCSRTAEKTVDHVQIADKVWRNTCCDKKRTKVVFKEIPKSTPVCSDEEIALIRHQFFQEIGIMKFIEKARIDHDNDKVRNNVLKYYGFREGGEAKKSYSIMMESIEEAVSLMAALTKTSNTQTCDLDPDKLTRELIKQLAPLLEFLSDNKLIHGDIKPDNVLVAKGQESESQIRAYLIDFDGSVSLNEEHDFHVQSMQEFRRAVSIDYESKAHRDAEKQKEIDFLYSMSPMQMNQMDMSPFVQLLAETHIRQKIRRESDATTVEALDSLLCKYFIQGQLQISQIDIETTGLKPDELQQFRDGLDDDERIYGCPVYKVLGFPKVKQQVLDTFDDANLKEFMQRWWLDMIHEEYYGNWKQFIEDFVKL